MIPATIRSLEDISNLIQSGYILWNNYGLVNVQYTGDLIQFNYKNEAQFRPPAAWNYFEIMARGLIFNSKGQLLAKPLPKFFNYGQLLPASDDVLIEATEKIDGSLIILFWNPDTWQWQTATRGSLVSDQAAWAKRWLTNQIPDLTKLNPEYTYLFEAVYPENRVVVNYGDESELYLIGARQLYGAHDMLYSELKVIADEVGFVTPQIWRGMKAESYLESAADSDANHEGFVLRYSDGMRYKVKGEAYLKAHKLMTGLSYNRVLDAHKSGALAVMTQGMLDEFLGELNEYKARIDKRMAEIATDVEEAFAIAPKDDRKDFAQWVHQNAQGLSGLMFAKWDGKPLEKLLYRWLELENKE